MTKTILMIISPKNFQDFEYNTPKSIFEKENYNIITASSGVDVALGAFGFKQEIDLDISDVEVKNYDAIIFIGGGGAVQYQNNEIAQNICKEAIKQKKLLCAICIAPTILAKAGVLNEINATVWNGNGEPAKFLEKFGAKFTDEEVTIDGNIITANGPPAAEKFAKVIIKKLK
jgi:protease I